MNKLVNDLAAEVPNRRRFLSKIAVASAAVGVVGTQKLGAQSSMITDVDILNFALNLEYLEAEFYTFATTGKSIDQLGIGVTGSGAAGPTTGGAQVSFASTGTTNYSAIFNEIAADERLHVSLIRGALTAAGAMPVARPAINLNALGVGFAGLTDFLQLARAFEDVGVTAYGGAAPLISDKAILGTAARIALAEGEHAAAVRLLVAQTNTPTTLLDGLDILPPPSGRRYFSLDANALTQVRTPGQVLYIVYGSQANAKSGGFFPNGVNGNINTASAGAAFSNQTVAIVTPSMLTTADAQVTLDATSSVSGPSGALTYAYSVAPGGLQPAILQNGNTNPKAIIQFVKGAGTYNLLLTVTDSNKQTSTAPITLIYKP